MLKNRRNVELEQSWRVHLQEQLTGGLSIAEYCRQQSLSAIQFYFWKRTIFLRDQDIASKSPKSTNRKRKVAPAKTAKCKTSPTSIPHRANTPPVNKEAELPAFIPVLIPHPVVLPERETPIEIILPGQQTIRVLAGCDRQLLAEIVHLLGESSC